MRSRLPFGYCFFVLVLTIVGCSLGCPGPTTAPAKTWNVAPRTLYLEFRDGDTRRTGDKIRVFLEPASYELDGKSALHWFDRRVTSHPDIVFELRSEVAANDKALYVEGQCAGRCVTSTGHAYILVRDCSVTLR